MDWRFALFALEEGLPGLLAMGATLPVFMLASMPGRCLKASAPSLAALAVFGLTCLLAGIPNVQPSQLARAFPLVGAATVLALIVPSTLALRWRWLALLHSVTLVASAYLWFVGSLAISHDAT